MNLWSRLMGRGERVEPKPAEPKPNNVTLEQKLEILACCGLALDAPFSVPDLLESWSREDYEQPGFNLVLVGLGMQEEKPPWRPHSENVWHFDTECIEDDGSYARIAERFKSMARGSLPIENVTNHVDLEAGTAWIEFDFRGERHHIDCTVENDWVDTKLFGHFVKLLATSDDSKIFIYYDLGGQDCILACVAKDQLDALNSNGIAFEPLG